MLDRPIYGLLLAGGKSRRMGKDKALLDRDGEPQLAYAARVIGECVDRLFVSTQADQGHDVERRRFEQIVDKYDDIGPVAGILSALEAHRDVDWLVVACDLPNIETGTMRNLISKRDSARPFTAYKSSYDGLPEPLCALYGPSSFEIVRDFVQDGLVCPRKIMIRSDSQLLSLANPDSLDNVNTPDDLRSSVLRATQ